MVTLSVEPASSAFEAQQSFISELEHQMQNLGLSTLFSQKMGAETAESKSSIAYRFRFAAVHRFQRSASQPAGGL